MKISRLQYITNGSSEKEILEEVSAVIAAGVNWVQLRIKNPVLNVLEIGYKVREMCCEKAIFILNDHVETAKKLDADGVHLGLTDLPIADARKILGSQKIIGGTANTFEDCLERQNCGADYIGLGPYRTTITKEKLSPILGVEGYEKILPKEDGSINLPVVAIGGIQVGDIPGLIACSNVHGIAVSGLIKNAPDKVKIVTEINRALQTNTVRDRDSKIKPQSAQR